MEEVVITGMGCVTALGNDPDTLWANLLAGKSGVATVDRFDVSKFSVRFAGQIREFDSSPWFSERDAKRTSRYIQYVVHSSEKALEMSGLKRDEVDVKRAGVIVGSGMGGMEIFKDSSANLAARGPRRISPFFVPMAISNMASGEVGIRMGWMGPNWAATSACATSNHSIITAADQIRMGRADVMLAGGAEEAVCDIGLGGFASMKALSTRNDEPQRASRPFDKDRDGFILGEGSGVFVLESLSHAKARGAKILARLSGYGVSCDAHHMSAPREDGAGVILAVQNALQDAGLEASDVGYVNCHGTSTPLGDAAEGQAIAKAFGSHAQSIKINSTKSMIGHALGAASAIELVVVIKSLQDQKIHQTLNLENQDERIELDCVANGPVDHRMEYAMSNSFGFGGHNSTLVIGRP